MTSTPTQSEHIPFWERTLPLTPPQCLDGRTLCAIAAEAAQRAQTILNGVQRFEEDPVVDLIRIIRSTTADAAAVSAAAQRAKLDRRELARLMTAYTHGGTEGVRTAWKPHAASTDNLKSAADAIQAQPNAAVVEVQLDDNYVEFPTIGVQIRLSMEGNWFPYTCARDHWAPAPGQSPNPVAAYNSALQAKRNRS